MTPELERAIRDLYEKSFWVSDRLNETDSAKMWENLKDASGIEMKSPEPDFNALSILF